jgi:hypothetical protein
MHILVTLNPTVIRDPEEYNLVPTRQGPQCLSTSLLVTLNASMACRAAGLSMYKYSLYKKAFRVFLKQYTVISILKVMITADTFTCVG